MGEWLKRRLGTAASQFGQEAEGKKSPLPSHPEPVH